MKEALTGWLNHAAGKLLLFCLNNRISFFFFDVAIRRSIKSSEEVHRIDHSHRIQFNQLGRVAKICFGFIISSYLFFYIIEYNSSVYGGLSLLLDINMRATACFSIQ